MITYNYRLPMNIRMEVLSWCHDNVTVGYWVIRNGIITFSREQDAQAFTRRFGL